MERPMHFSTTLLNHSPMVRLLYMCYSETVILLYCKLIRGIGPLFCSHTMLTSIITTRLQYYFLKSYTDDIKPTLCRKVSARGHGLYQLQQVSLRAKTLRRKVCLMLFVLCMTWQNNTEFSLIYVTVYA